MSAPVFQSVTTGTTSANKPTGLAVGDLMIACGHNVSSSTIGLPSGFTSITGSESGTNFAGIRVGWKIADSSDVASSSFSFTNTLECSISRITGGGANIQGNSNTGGATTTPSFAGTTPKDYGDSILLMQFWTSNSSGGATTSGYAVATSNPSWTEGYDVQQSGFYGFAMAYATRTQVTATGNFSCVFSISGTNAGAIIAIPIPFATTTLETVTSTEVKLVDISILKSETVTSMEDSTTESPATQWRNKPKTAPGTVRNKPKSHG